MSEIQWINRSEIIFRSVIWFFFASECRSLFLQCTIWVQYNMTYNAKKRPKEEFFIFFYHIIKGNFTKKGGFQVDHQKRYFTIFTARNYLRFHLRIRIFSTEPGIQKRSILTTLNWSLFTSKLRTKNSYAIQTYAQQRVLSEELLETWNRNNKAFPQIRNDLPSKFRPEHRVLSPGL